MSITQTVTVSKQDANWSSVKDLLNELSPYWDATVEEKTHENKALGYLTSSHELLDAQTVRFLKVWDSEEHYNIYNNEVGSSVEENRDLIRSLGYEITETVS